MWTNMSSFVFESNGKIYSLKRLESFMGDPAEFSINDFVDVNPEASIDISIKVPIGTGDHGYVFRPVDSVWPSKPVCVLPNGTYKVTADLRIPYYIVASAKNDSITQSCSTSCRVYGDLVVNNQSHINQVDDVSYWRPIIIKVMIILMAMITIYIIRRKRLFRSERF